ncbi:TMV resistance protein like [Quillaja saponaria]|uniref:TMV resistance protein like n=1 Tax=Quillaja saponaria TaxID=32244 RepID=A0AAD7QHL7_QUISA|nr:TMV resistance protein like [Quillaja saponaria]
MYRSEAMIFERRFFSQQRRNQIANRLSNNPCDVFINHRSIDTKRTVATLVYDYLSKFNLHPFLDNKTMKPGDKLFDKINRAILDCKIGVAVFSPSYCQSYFCLHELALMMETNKKVIPIFCDVKPSQLRVVNKEKYTEEELKRFNLALEEARYTVGLTFNSSKGNLSDIVTSASDIVISSLIELENEKQEHHQKDMPIAL